MLRVLADRVAASRTSPSGEPVRSLHGGAARRPERVVSALVAVPLLAAGLAACSPLSSEEIPAEPAAPWVCDGVSRQTVDLILGEGYTVTQLGEWTDLEADPFTCEVNGIHGHVVVDVRQRPQATAADEGAQQLEAWRDSGGVQLENPLGVTGEGYLMGSPGDLVTAGWVCARRTVEVRLDTVWLDGTRDQQADASALLLQLLPYVCANEIVPGVDYSPGDGESGD